jgi:1,2-diacylglycerol 3-beta-galactosyltransferase
VFPARPHPQVGVFEKSPAKAAQLIKGWLGEQRAEFEEMKRRAKALGKPHALFDICRDLATLAPAPGTEKAAAKSLAAA